MEGWVDGWVNGWLTDPGCVHRWMSARWMDESGLNVVINEGITDTLMVSFLLF